MFCLHNTLGHCRIRLSTKHVMGAAIQREIMPYEKIENGRYFLNIQTPTNIIAKFNLVLVHYGIVYVFRHNQTLRLPSEILLKNDAGNIVLKVNDRYLLPHIRITLEEFIDIYGVSMFHESNTENMKPLSKIHKIENRKLSVKLSGNYDNPDTCNIM